MFEDTQPAALGDTGTDAWAPFRVDNPTEVRALLRQLRDGAVPMVLSAPSGTAVVASLWSLDSDQQRVNFTAGDHDPLLQQLIAGDEAVAVGYLESVKLQFDLHDLLLVRGASSCALQARWPSELYRFQRRSAYRVRTLERHAPTARLRHPAIPEMQLALRVLDVSIGGCALFLPADVPALEPGVLLHGVQVELDADTRFGATLQIQHISSIASDAQDLRAGCEWRTLTRESERSLQRYIDQTQKRRRLLALD
jgi:c-di-GMP-binding flagellar brake protein YcgR